MGGRPGALGARPRSPRLWRPPPWVPRPSRGGCAPADPLPGLRPSAGRGGGRGGKGGGGGGVPRSPPMVPWRRPPAVAGEQPGGSGPGGPAANGRGALVPRPLLVPDPPAGSRSGPPLSSLPPRVAGWPGGGGRAGDSGQLLGVSGLPPPSPLLEVVRAPPPRRTVGGWGSRPGSGGPALRGGGVPQQCPLPGPSRSSPGQAGRGRHPRRCLRGGWGCGCGGLRWRWRQWLRALRKARGSQLLESASVMPSTAPPSRRGGQVGSLSGDTARITAQRTPSWSSGATHPPGGTSRFPPSLRRSTASKSRFLISLVIPEQAQLSHPYTTTRGRASPPRGSGTVSQSRSQGRAPSAPRAGPPCGPCVCGAGVAPRPPAAGAAAICAGPALGAGGGGWCWGRGSWGGMSSPVSGSML